MNKGTYYYIIKNLYSKISGRNWLKINELSKKIGIPIEISEDLTGIYVNSSEDLAKTEQDMIKGRANQFLFSKKEDLSEMTLPSKDFESEEKKSLEADAFYTMNLLTEHYLLKMKREFDKTGKIVLRHWIFGTSDPKYSNLKSYGNHAKKWERDPFPDNNYGRLPQCLLRTVEYAISKKS